ncbi:AAA family ATPase [Streptomyces sp. 11x1]|uniref:AAA family ATPase n=1 Tax=Streptomyces sp. 11x1 TaxID=3038642 RepID=UPI00292D6BBE|nr:AAA family ATPase [Streptomyces sp. 11x1]WNZ06180.1 AAA family ATPase [Streptomyces sp. 11x1]WNZ11660.1 AAA family ATPase [Streptomyces sp. 11x1]WNZ12671.1 AAA family ATPase [Streptomyces sp. 11x1]
MIPTTTDQPANRKQPTATGPTTSQEIYLITGIPAAGKSTIAQLLAERLPRSVHVRGDLFRRMVINGRAEMTADPSEEAVRQLRLRHQLTAQTIDSYFETGFTVVAQDVILGEHLARMIAQIRSRPLHVIALTPHPDAIAARDTARSKTAYDAWTIGPLDHALRQETPRRGLWIDTSEQTPTQTVDEILARAPGEARIELRNT